MELGRGGSNLEFSAEPDPVPAYLAVADSGSGRGILVVHDDWGLTDQIRDVCDRLARAGFVALAPDLFRGRTAADSGAAQRLSAGLDVDRAAADLDHAVVELYNQNATTGRRCGAVGFGMGGQLALLGASRNRRIGAVVDFYGAHPDVKPDFPKIEAAVLAIFAGDDHAIPEPCVRSIEADVGRAGVRASIQTRNGVCHGYMDDARPDVYDAVAAAEGWDTLLAFLQAELP